MECLTENNIVQDFFISVKANNLKYIILEISCASLHLNCQKEISLY